MVKYFENLLNRKADKIRLLLSKHKAEVKVQLVSKCLTTMKFMPAYNTLIGYFIIMLVWEIPHGNPIAGLC